MTSTTRMTPLVACGDGGGGAALKKSDVDEADRDKSADSKKLDGKDNGNASHSRVLMAKRRSAGASGSSERGELPAAG